MASLLLLLCVNAAQSSSVSFEHLVQSSDFDCESYGWCALSHLNVENSSDSTLNIAMPGYSSFYYVSMIQPGEQHTYASANGLPQQRDGFFSASLCAYDIRTGLPLDGQYFDSVGEKRNNDTLQQGVLMPTTPQNFTTSVLQRLYLDDRILDQNRVEDFLVSVFSSDGAELPVASPGVMRRNSDVLTAVVGPLCAKETVPIEFKGRPFMMSNNASGLYPDPTNIYVDANPTSDRPVMRITGRHAPAWMQAHSMPYLDFMAVNHATSATDDSLPFYLWGSLPQAHIDYDYEIFVAPGDARVATTSPIIRWSNETATEERVLIMRVMDTSCFRGECTGLAAAARDALAQNRTRLTAQETQKALGFMYPTVEYLTLEQAAAP